MRYNNLTQDYKRLGLPEQTSVMVSVTNGSILPDGLRLPFGNTDLINLQNENSVRSFQARRNYQRGLQGNNGRPLVDTQNEAIITGFQSRRQIPASFNNN
jgi:hypothetical protein